MQTWRVRRGGPRAGVRGETGGCCAPRTATYRGGVADRPTDDLVKVAKDSLYVTVGLGLLAYQRLQVRRHELSRAAEADGSSPLGKFVGDNLRLVEERMLDAEERIDRVLDEVESALPGPARAAVSNARNAARETRDGIRKLF